MSKLITTRRLRPAAAVLLIITAMFAAVANSAGSSSGVGAQAGSRTFPETGQTVRGKFLDYWNGNRGLPQQGYPISGEIEEVSDLNGKTYMLQYFERAVFEHHPEYAGTPFEVLLSHLGTFEYRKKYPNGAPNQVANGTNAHLFPETGKTLGGRFRQYWEQNGGLMQQGYPISDEFKEVSPLDGKTYTVQYFERAVFEHHPENSAPYDVLLSHLGRFRYQARYGAAGPPAGAAVPRYGIDFVRGGSAAQAGEGAAAGARLARIYVSWAELEPNNTTPANFNFTGADARLGTLTAAGLKPILTFTDCPRWACPDGNGPITSAPMSEVAQVTAAVAARYRVAPYDVHLWEFWNEPDATYGPDREHGWGLHGDNYARMLAAAAPAVRGADPAAKIALGGVAYDFFMDATPPGPFNRNFLRDVLRAGGGAHFDYMNFHYYPQQPYYSAIDQKAAKIKELMAQLGLDKPIIVTETSLTSDPAPAFQHPQWGPSSDAVQSRFLAQTFIQAFASGVESVSWFNVQDWDTDVAGWEIFEKTGLLRLDGSRKPVFAAYRTMVDMVGERPYARRLTAAELGSAQVEGHAFGGSGAEVWAVWRAHDPARDRPGEDRQVRVDMPTRGRTPAAVRNTYGESQTAAPNGGTLRVTLSGAPMYIEWR